MFSAQRFEQYYQKVNDNCKELASIMNSQQKQIQHLEIVALLQGMFYVAVQLIIFLFTLKPSRALCRNWWKPFSISILLAVMFGLNFVATMIKYLRTTYEQDRSLIHRLENFQEMAALERHRANGQPDMAIDLPKHMDEQQERQEQKPDMFAVYQRYAHLGTTGCLLLVYTVLVLHACRFSSASTFAEVDFLNEKVILYSSTKPFKTAIEGHIFSFSAPLHTVQTRVGCSSRNNRKIKNGRLVVEHGNQISTVSLKYAATQSCPVFFFSMAKESVLKRICPFLYKEKQESERFHVQRGRKIVINLLSPALSENRLQQIIEGNSLFPVSQAKSPLIHAFQTQKGRDKEEFALYTSRVQT